MTEALSEARGILDREIKKLETQSDFIRVISKCPCQINPFLRPSLIVLNLLLIVSVLSSHQVNSKEGAEAENSPCVHPGQWP